MNTHQPPVRATEQWFHPFVSGSGAGAAEQVALIAVFAFSGRAACCRGIAPAAPDVEANAGRQGHHVVVMAAVAQGLPQFGACFAQGHEGIELPDFLEELLELGFGHGRRT